MMFSNQSLVFLCCCMPIFNDNPCRMSLTCCHAFPQQTSLPGRATFRIVTEVRLIYPQSVSWCAIEEVYQLLHWLRKQLVQPMVATHPNPRDMTASLVYAGAECVQLELQSKLASQRVCRCYHVKHVALQGQIGKPIRQGRYPQKQLQFYTSAGKLMEGMQSGPRICAFLHVDL